MSEMLKRVAEFSAESGACGSQDPKPSACGTSEPKPSACGTACGSGEPQK